MLSMSGQMPTDIHPLPSGSKGVLFLEQPIILLFQVMSLTTMFFADHGKELESITIGKLLPETSKIFSFFADNHYSDS
jgi:hypothetical protein